MTDAALSYLGADDLLAELLARVKEILDADMVAVLLLDSSGRQLIATAASGLEEEVRQGVRIPVGQGFAGRIAAGRRPVILDHVDHGNVLNPILLDKGIQSLVGVPLLVHGAVIGVLHVGTVRNRVFTADDATLLQLAADRAALAVQSLRSREDRAAAAALQRSLLPSALPVVTGVEAAARYVSGEGQVGGDWCDVFPLPWGELGVVVGAPIGRPAAWPAGSSRCVRRFPARASRVRQLPPPPSAAGGGPRRGRRPRGLWAFSRTRSSSRAACQVARSTTGGRSGSAMVGSSGVVVMVSSVVSRAGQRRRTSYDGHQNRLATRPELIGLADRAVPFLRLSLELMHSDKGVRVTDTKYPLLIREKLSEHFHCFSMPPLPVYCKCKSLTCSKGIRVFVTE